MTASTKTGLAFVTVGLVAGYMTSALGLQHLQKWIWVSLLILCFVTVFLISSRDLRRNRPSQSDGGGRWFTRGFTRGSRRRFTQEVHTRVRMTIVPNVVLNLRLEPSS